MSETNPTTQLVEAIEARLDDQGILYRHSAPKLGNLKATGSKNVDLVNGLLLAIADAVDTQIGEDVKLDNDGSPRYDKYGKDLWGDKYAAIHERYARAVNSANARMRTFTAALRERAK